MSDHLTPKQERFVRVYLTNGGNASAAYRKAYDAAGMSDDAIYVEASRLLDNPKISLRIDTVRKRAEERTQASAEKVLSELALVANQRAGDLYAEDGSILPPDEWDDALSATIAGVEVFEEFEGHGDDRHLVGHTRKVKRWDKVKALELLGKHFKLFPTAGSLTLTGADGGKPVIGIEIVPTSPPAPDEPADEAE